MKTLTDSMSKLIDFARNKQEVTLWDISKERKNFHDHGYHSRGIVLEKDDSFLYEDKETGVLTYLKNYALEVERFFEGYLLILTGVTKTN